MAQEKQKQDYGDRKIYKSTGAAGEYAEYSYNPFKGCDHGCKYCYVPKIMRKNDYIHSDVYVKDKEELIKMTKKAVKGYEYSKTPVFMSFTTDPYQQSTRGMMRPILQVFLDNHIPVMLLTKGPSLMLEDMDIIKQFGPNIQVGCSLTFISNDQSKIWEPNGDLPKVRFDVLKQFHDAGVKTWASMEPVIDPAASLAIMELVHEYVDVFKVGKVNHAKSIEQKVNWTEFLNLAVFTLNKNGNEYYIKDDLYAYANEDTLKMLLPKHRNRLHSLIKSTWNDPFEGLFDDKTQQKLF
jgi:DNA repair photolyase